MTEDNAQTQMNTAQTFTIGDVEVVRVVEWARPYAPARTFVPDLPPGVWQEHRETLAPDHWDPETDRAVVALQTWVVRSAGRTVLVDTGVGNGRERPGNPLFHMSQGDLPGRLARAGVRPEDVDVVVNTHIHGDHVGWNTHDVEGVGSRCSTTRDISSLPPTTSTSGPRTTTAVRYGPTTA